MNKKDELVANIQLLKDLNMKPNISELARAYDLDRRTVKKYFEAARQTNPHLPTKISPHILRHSKAMHMLQAGINLIYIRDFLGHVHVETTEIYAKADTEMKRRAIESAHIQIDPDLPAWTDDKDLMALLTNLCGKD